MPLKARPQKRDLPEDGHLDLLIGNRSCGSEPKEYTPSVPEGGVGRSTRRGRTLRRNLARPRTSHSPGGYVPYLNAERDKPTTVQTINGITVGPGRRGVREADREECASEPRSGRYDDVADEEMAIDPDVLPPDAEPISDGGDWEPSSGEDRALTVGVEAAIPPDKHGAILGGSGHHYQDRGAAVSAISHS